MLALAAIHWLVVVQGVAEPLVPGPERVVAQFITGLATRPAQVLLLLEQNLRDQTSVDDLRRLDAQLRRKYQGYQFQSGGHEVREEHSVQYVTLLKISDGRTIKPVFELRRNHSTGMWQITSFRHLSLLARPVPQRPAQEVLISI